MNKDVMTEASKYFPEGVAIGSAFINRVEERNFLINRITANKHTVLIAPRRYGKTSLVMQVANEMQLPYCSIDLLAAYNEEYVRDQLVSKVGSLALELLPSINKAKEKLLNIFKHMRAEISVGAFGQRLSLDLSKNPLNDITQLLLKLDETAKQFKRKAVIFIDEFQQISYLNNYHSIEASIRHAVERSENIAYVFSGSNRQLLKQMFGDRGRPLYRLCQTTTIDRMSKEVYFDYLQKRSEEKWHKIMPNEIIERILLQTESHPFYMNVLCQLIWEKSNMATSQQVDEIWHEYVKTQRQIISYDSQVLSNNQRKLIMALAKNPTKEIQSIDFIGPLKISPSSAQQALSVLLNKDLVYKTKEGFYKILDPAMNYYLRVILWESESIISS